MPPKFIAKNADRTSGVLPVNAAARANSSKASTVRLKLEIRRLPPGLTLVEFEETVGDEWKLGNGKVDWREYRQGKTRAPGSGKVPEQSRCYLHVLNETCVKDFEKRFLEVVFHDKAGTHKNPDLKNLQPTLEFAPNQRTPLQQAKPRLDTRQGTIDQDPEFIAFLESETQPIAKPAALDAAALERDGEKKEIKTTPLIEDLREKKANKAKAAQAKAEKVEKDKKSQTLKSTAKDATVVKEDGGKGSQQPKVEQAAKDAARALNKQAATKQPLQNAQQPKVSPSAKPKKTPPNAKPLNATPASTQPVAASSSPSTPSPGPQRVPPSQRQRGSTDGIKKMLQKDLGIKPKSTPSPQLSTTTASTSTPSSPPSASSAIPAATTASTVTPAPASTSLVDSKALPVKAYLKHANPSQGMTEILIQQALASYGEVANVTIDPRKGTAIAVFKQNEGLKKALEAKRVSVANGAVEVLEFRDRPTSGSVGRGGFRGGRGGRGGSRGGAQTTTASTAAPAAAAPAATSSG